MNDMLGQLEACCRYAELAGRTVIVDTAYPGAANFRDPIDRYFASRQGRLLFGLDKAPGALAAATVMPEFLQGRVNSYVPVWGPSGIWNEQLGRDWNGWIDSQTGQRLSFDFGVGHRHELLVHHSQGRNPLAMFALMRMQLRPALGDELRRRLGAIGGPYDAIHVRHTDYRSDYAARLQALAASPPDRLFVATDNAAVLEQFRAALGAQRVFSFSALPDRPGEPLHRPSADADLFERNRDAIVDLLMVALARQVIRVKLSAGPAYSGFTELAHNLWSAKPVLKQLIARDDIVFGLH